MTFFKTPKLDSRDQDPGLEAASESVDGELTNDDGEGKGEDEVIANSLPSDTVINDHVASVIMMDEGEHDDVSTMENVACGNEDICIGGSRSPSSSSQNEEIFTNDVCKEFTSMLLNTGSLSDFGNFCYELMNMMELGKFEKGSIFSDSKAKLLRQRWFSAKTLQNYHQGMYHRLAIQNKTLFNVIVS